MKSNIQPSKNQSNYLLLPRYQHQPYYIVAPAYQSNHFGSRILHELCSLLNQSGYEAYVETPSISGGLWTPLLTAAVRAAHYKAKKKPIVIYPDAIKGHPLKLGLIVRCMVAGANAEQVKKTFISHELVYECQPSDYPEVAQLLMPVTDSDLFTCPDNQADRQTVIVFIDGYTGSIWQHGSDVVQISQKDGKTTEELKAIYQKAQVLYSYEWSVATIEARLCGCPVVFVPNAQCLPNRHPAIDFYGCAGSAWGLESSALNEAKATLGMFRSQYLKAVSGWQIQLSAFIEKTQTAAHQAEPELIWPQSTVDSLLGVYTEAKDLAASADRRKWQKLNDQYTKWSERSTLREIDAQIYAELAVSGTLPKVSVVIDQRATSTDALADSLDSLMACLGQPAEVNILSNDAVPDGFAQTDVIRWIQVGINGAVQPALQSVGGDWLLLLQAGTLLAPQALMEWAWASTQSPDLRLIYADEDVQQPDGARVFPHFKPDANIEFLRCTNYLGNALLVRSEQWFQSGSPLFDGGLYGYALTLLDQYGKAAVGHVDTVLFHASGRMSANLENQEFEAARHASSRREQSETLKPLNRWGTWLVEYAAPQAARVSLVIPTGLQTGYLRSFLEALQRYPEPALIDIVLVCNAQQVEEVRFVIADLVAYLVQIVPMTTVVYNHSAALNEGIRHAKGDVILVADDDTEPLHSNWLSLVLGVLAQPDVACVAPRLVLSRDKDAKVVCGPMVLGVNGAMASYIGEDQRLEEVGVFSRLQLTQDVSAVAGHFFLVRKTDWASVGGFDTHTFGLLFSVLDFCLRLSELGKRHVWTPLTGILHHGGKTLSSLRRDVRQQVALNESEIHEREALLTRWATKLATDPNYNRHLSLTTPFDIEADIVVDWQPKRHDRPRAMAVPVHSGAGQYRVIEPLNALQDAGLAQSCVVLPSASGRHRVVQPLEVVRAAPDRLILQHSVDDGQLRQIEHYRRAAPSVKIVQSVDDLFGEVPEKHPNRQFQSREGHQRMMQALMLSDRLIVTTQPLVDHYQRYVPDVQIVPNSLGEQWLGLCKTPSANARLRIGWVGAGQHQGDLEIVTEVVRELASEVDWVFMGMCTEGIKPFLKEFHGFVSIADYPKKMSELNLDVAIAPLEDNIFNRCKSNLRLLEYGAMGWPVVCSDVYPYRTDDPPVIRVENQREAWITAIRSLLDEKKRKTYSRDINQWLFKRYLLSSRKQDWFSAIFGN